jgi:hypothetical protein
MEDNLQCPAPCTSSRCWGILSKVYTSVLRRGRSSTRTRWPGLMSASDQVASRWCHCMPWMLNPSPSQLSWEPRNISKLFMTFRANPGGLLYDHILLCYVTFTYGSSTLHTEVRMSRRVNDTHIKNGDENVELLWIYMTAGVAQSV